jgi:thioredoxin-dependent peroxiredoxin
VALGVSPDSAESHRKFKAKYGLPMTLLVDEDHAIAEAYGVWVEKNTFGVKRKGIARTTFVIDPDGQVAHVFDKVDPSGHGDAVAKVLEGLRGKKKG